jgi:hypothetical protein
MFRQAIFSALLFIGAVRSDSGVNCQGINAISPKCKGPEAAYEREYFYVGGRYIYNATTNITLLTWQLFVEKLTPPDGVKQPHPVILMTAGVPSGAVRLSLSILQKDS